MMKYTVVNIPSDTFGSSLVMNMITLKIPEEHGGKHW